MSAKAIFEADGKAILNYHLTRAPVIKPSPLPNSTTHNPPSKLASLHFPEDAAVSSILDNAESLHPWLLAPGAKFVAKPDQLIKRRGKSGLLALNKTWPEAKAWIAERAGKPQKVETVVGVLRHFLVEPFVPHPDGTEYYININSQREVCQYSLSSAHILAVARAGRILEVSRIRASAVAILREHVYLENNHIKYRLYFKVNLHGAKQHVLFDFGTIYGFGTTVTGERKLGTRTQIHKSENIPITPKANLVPAFAYRRYSFRSPRLLYRRFFIFPLSYFPPLVQSTAVLLVVHVLINVLRETGSSSHMKGVSTLVMSMPKPKNY